MYISFNTLNKFSSPFVLNNAFFNLHTDIFYDFINMTQVNNFTVSAL